MFALWILLPFSKEPFIKFVSFIVFRHDFVPLKQGIMYAKSLHVAFILLQASAFETYLFLFNIPVKLLEFHQL